MNNYSILIDCPDEYLDILVVFFNYLQVNWPDRKSPIYITTNSKTIVVPENVTFIKCCFGNNSVERSKKALEEIKDKYVLILDCDCFISKPVDEKTLTNLVDYMEQNDIKYIKLWKSTNFEQRKYKTDFSKMYFCNKKARYTRSLMANIWERDEYIKEVVDSGLNGWQIEAKWLSESKKSQKGYFANYLYYSKDPLHILHSISKGMWVRSAFRKSVRKGMIDKKNNTRKLLPIKQTIKNNISSFLYNHLSAKIVYKLKDTVGSEKFVSKD